MQQNDELLAKLAVGPKPGAYRHYKGGLYEVIGSGFTEATLEPIVIYKNAEGTLWTRPFDDWFKAVEVDGVPVSRFSPIE